MHHHFSSNASLSRSDTTDRMIVVLQTKDLGDLGAGAGRFAQGDELLEKTVPEKNIAAIAANLEIHLVAHAHQLFTRSLVYQIECAHPA